MRFIKANILCLLLAFLAGCSGYRFTNPANPLFQFGINQLALMQFENQTTLGGVSGVFTSEYFRLLNSYPGLVLSSSIKSETDAVMLGILRSGPKARVTEMVTGRQRASDLAPISMGGRRTFFIPTSKQVTMSLQVIIIRDPTDQDIKLAQSSLPNFLKRNPRIILNSILPVEGAYSLEILDGAGTQVNQTQNRGLRRKMLLQLARESANVFKETVLGVY